MTPHRDRFSRRSASLALAVAIAGASFFQAGLQHGAGLLAASAAEDAPIDFRRLRPLMEKVKAGEKLTPEEHAYVDRARQQMRSRAGHGPPGAGWGTVDTSGLVPLTDLTGTYKGEDGGLYGGGRNEPPEAHLAAYLKESEQIQPLDAEGRPAEDGKIGLVTIGFSNTHLESADFKRTADSDPQKSPRVVIVDGAMGMRAAVMWAYDGADVLPKSEQERLDKEMDQLRMPKTNRKGPPGAPDKDTWPTLDQRLKADPGTRRWFVNPAAGNITAPRRAATPDSGLSAADPAAARPAAAAKIADEPIDVERGKRLMQRFSAGEKLTPEDQAYLDRVRQEIRRRSGQRGIGPMAGKKREPVPRDPHVNKPEMDGMHPSPSGKQKVVQMLLTFFKTDPLARVWFLNL